MEMVECLLQLQEMQDDHATRKIEELSSHEQKIQPTV